MADKVRVKGGQYATHYLSIGLLSIAITQGPYTLSFDLSQFEFSVENGFDRVRRIEMSKTMVTNTPEFSKSTSGYISSNNGYSNGVSVSNPLMNDEPFKWSISYEPVIKGHVYDCHIVRTPIGIKTWVVGEKGQIALKDEYGIWHTQNSGTNADLIDVFFIDSYRGWAVGGAATISEAVILHTTNGGLDWLPQTSGVPGCGVSCFFIDANNGWVSVQWYPFIKGCQPQGYILKTTDGGAHWQAIPIPYHTQPEWPTQPMLHGLFFLNSQVGWLTGCELNPVQPPPQRAVLFKTTDGGITWLDYTYRLPPEIQEEDGTTGIYFVDAMKGFLGSRSNDFAGHLVITTDGGESWFTHSNIGNPFQIEFVSATEGFMTVWTTEYLKNITKILHTTDGGNTWFDDQLIPVYIYLGWGMKFSDNQNGCLVGDKGLIVQTAGNGIWNIQNLSADLTSLNFTDVGSGWGVGDRGIILHTTNNGENWQFQSCGDRLCTELYDVDFVSPLIGWISGRNLSSDNFISKTTDGGVIWTPHYTLHPIKAVDFVNENAGWGCGDNGIYFSNDGGVNWVPQLITTETFRDISFSSINKGWAVSSQGIWHTDDGLNWFRQFNQPGLFNVDFVNNKCGWTSGVRGKIFVTTDGGTSWIQQSAGTTLPFTNIDFYDEVNGSAVAYGISQAKSIIFQTRDRGETWYNSLEIPSSSASKALHFLNSRTVWLAESEARIFRYHSEFEKTGTYLTTAYQARKLIFQLNSQNAWTVYQTGKRIFASSFESTNWHPRAQLGKGEFPCIALDATNKPCVIWQMNVEIPPLQKGGELWFSKNDGTNWTEPYLLASFVGPFNLDVNLPSFTIDPTTNTGYVVFEWRDRFIDGPTSHLYLGWFDVNNPANIQFSELEFALAPERCEFPSISQGGNYLYIAFQREHKIFRIKWDIVNQQIVDRYQISQDGRFSRHPYCDVQANGVINYVWEDSVGFNTDIYRCYEWNSIISSPEPVVTTPGKSQWPQICKGTTWITWSEFIYPPTDNNWEICYKDMEYEGYQILSQTLEMSKYSHGVVTRSHYWPPPYEPKLTAIWTEGNRSPYEIRSKTVALPEIPYFYADAGKEAPSPWTVQREGYIQFASEPEKTIDYHSQKLIYHFPNLNPEKRYRIKLVFYFESQGNNRWRMKIDGDNIFHANVWIKSKEITTLERWLPTACYKDGEIYLNITKIIGDYALVAQIFIYEYERETEEITKNTQESQNSQANRFSLSISPNPCHSQATIRYSLPNQSPATIKIYDTSGQLVKQFSHLTQLFNKIVWNGVDDNGKTISNGIYFVVLENGKECLMQKLVFTR